MYLPTFFPKMFMKIPFSLIIFFYSFLALEAFERPNIILIMTDDMGRECIEAHGGTSYKTPHLNGLAAQGLQINHCYSQPICTPSRVKIMTGKYNFRNYEGFGGLPKQEKTFGHALQDAGYKTCIVGKWQLGGNHQDILNFGFESKISHFHLFLNYLQLFTIFGQTSPYGCFLNSKKTHLKDKLKPLFLRWSPS